MDAKEVVIVLGVPNSGKSYFIDHNLRDYYVVDLYDYQKHIFSYEDIVKSYNECEKALREACHKYEKVVLEHTLVLSKRRGQYINAVKDELGKDFPITCYYTNIELDDYIKYDKMDVERWEKEHPGMSARLADPKMLEKTLNQFEIPTVEEGFIEVIRIKN